MSTIKVLMIPTLRQYEGEASGIATVVRRYHKYFPQFDIELVDDKAETYDLKAVHAGMTAGDCDVCHCHGLYFTADYPAAAWEYKANANVIDALRHAKISTVPSSWVAEIIARDMRFYPEVVPHGVEWDSWQHDEEDTGYVLWAKNRAEDVCTPRPVVALATKNTSQVFVTTFLPKDTALPNVRNLNGALPFDQMKKMVQKCSVYLATTKETGGIAVLEAMAAGRPILGYNWGNIPNLAPHGVAGYMAKPGDENDLNEGLQFCLKYKKVLGENGRQISRKYTWENAVREVRRVYDMALGMQA